MSPERADRENLLTREEAAKELADIWLSYWRGGQTNLGGERREQTLSILERLTPEDRDYFLRETEGGSETPLAQIREKARILARNARNARSKGERLHIRRQKARQRHGTDPKKIH